MKVYVERTVNRMPSRRWAIRMAGPDGRVTTVGYRRWRIAAEWAAWRHEGRIITNGPWTS